MAAPAILHVTSLFGGGVDRHLRDAVAGVARPALIWHAGALAEAMEDTASSRVDALVPEAFASGKDAIGAYLRSHRVGLVHLHSLGEAERERAAWAAKALGAPLVVTLHDILFLDAKAFERADPLAGDPAWLAKTGDFLRTAAAVIAPSRWLADLARERIRGLTVEVIENGVGSSEKSGSGEDFPQSGKSSPDPDFSVAPRAAFAARRPRACVAMLGAIGPHKGAELADDIAQHLAPHGIALVVVGYLDRQLFPGWRGESIFVHGPFRDVDGPALLRAYGAKLVVMPNAVPDSFSYALSDAWIAGVPVVAAPVGAIAERIGEHDGGWLLPPAFDGQVVAREIVRLVDGDLAEDRRRVESLLSRPDPARVPTLDAMTRSLDALYARLGIDPADPGAAGKDAIAHLVATNLDGRLLRAELARLADETAQALGALESTKARADAFEKEARGWIGKLEADVAALQSALRESDAARDALAKEADALRLDREALERLPSILRRILRKLAFDARR
jgi:glycosyltransferase involved in cell wall biosynthesis